MKIKLGYFERFFCKHDYRLVPFARDKNWVVCVNCKKSLNIIINTPQK